MCGWFFSFLFLVALYRNFVSIYTETRRASAHLLCSARTHLCFQTEKYNFFFLSSHRISCGRHCRRRRSRCRRWCRFNSIFLLSVTSSTAGRDKHFVVLLFIPVCVCVSVFSTIDAATGVHQIHNKFTKTEGEEEEGKEERNIPPLHLCDVLMCVCVLCTEHRLPIVTNILCSLYLCVAHNTEQTMPTLSVSFMRAAVSFTIHLFDRFYFIHFRVHGFHFSGAVGFGKWKNYGCCVYVCVYFFIFFCMCFMCIWFWWLRFPFFFFVLLFASSLCYYFIYHKMYFIGAHALVHPWKPISVFVFVCVCVVLRSRSCMAKQQNVEWKKLINNNNYTRSYDVIDVWCRCSSVSLARNYCTGTAPLHFYSLGVLAAIASSAASNGRFSWCRVRVEYVSVECVSALYGQWSWNNAS